MQQLNLFYSILELCGHVSLMTRMTLIILNWAPGYNWVKLN